MTTINDYLLTYLLGNCIGTYVYTNKQFKTNKIGLGITAYLQWLEVRRLVKKLQIDICSPSSSSFH